MDPLPVRDDQPFFDPVNVEVEVGSRRDPESAIRLLIIAALLVALGLVANRFLPLLLNNQDGSEAITIRHHRQRSKGSSAAAKKPSV